jgi:hypothetical protein
MKNEPVTRKARRAQDHRLDNGLLPPIVEQRET